MDNAERHGKLSFVLQLLEDLRIFHQSNFHRCSCDICDKKTTFISSTIAKAIEEVGCVSSSLAHEGHDDVDRKTGHDKESRKAAEFTVLVKDFDSKRSKNDLSSSELCGDGECNSRNRQKESDNDPISPSMENKLCKKFSDTRHLPVPSSNASQSLLSSTQKDSGVHCENLLHMHSISPIRSIINQNDTSESEFSVTSMLKPEEITSSCNSCDRDCTEVSTNEKPVSNQEEKIISQAASTTQNSSSPITIAAPSMTSLSPFHIPSIVCGRFTTLPSSSNPALGWIPGAFYPVPVLPDMYPTSFAPHPNQTNISFPPPPRQYPKMLYPPFVGNFQRFLVQNSNLNQICEMHLTDLFSKIEITEEKGLQPKQDGSLTDKEEVKDEGQSQSVEIEFEKETLNSFSSETVDDKHDSQKNFNLIDYQSQDSVVCSKNVMLSEARGLTDSVVGDQRKDLSFNASNSSQESQCSSNDSRFDAMWRPWEVKDDIFRILSDSSISIEEEESSETDDKCRQGKMKNENVLDKRNVLKGNKGIPDSHSFDNTSCCMSPCKKAARNRRKINLKSDIGASESHNSSTTCKKSLMDEEGFNNSEPYKQDMKKSDPVDGEESSEKPNYICKDTFGEMSPLKPLSESVALFEEDVRMDKGKSNSPKPDRKSKCQQALFSSSEIDLTGKENKNKSNNSFSPKVQPLGHLEEHLWSLNDISNKPFNQRSILPTQKKDTLDESFNSEQKLESPVESVIIIEQFADSINNVEENCTDLQQRDKEEILKTNSKKRNTLLDVCPEKGYPSIHSIVRDAEQGHNSSLQTTSVGSKKGHVTTKTFPPNNKRRDVVKLPPPAVPSSEDPTTRKVPSMGTLRRVAKLQRNSQSEETNSNYGNGECIGCDDEDKNTGCENNKKIHDHKQALTHQQTEMDPDLNHDVHSQSEKEIHGNSTMTKIPAWGAPAVFPSAPVKSIPSTSINGNEMTVPKKPSRKQGSRSNVSINRDPSDQTCWTQDEQCSNSSDDPEKCSGDLNSQTTSFRQPCIAIEEENKALSDEFTEAEKQIKNDLPSPQKHLCKQFRNLCIDDSRNMNRSLPLPPTMGKKATQIQAMKDGNSGDGRESFEANQSFPKMAEIQRPDDWEAMPKRSVGAQNLVLDLHQGVGTPLREKGLTPRNRRSIFGFSPPGLSPRTPQGRPAHVEKDDGLNSSMSPEHQGKQSVSPQCPLDKFLSAFDMSSRFPRPPELEEILFNCVISCICLVDASLQGKIVSMNEAFQLMVGIHEKVLGLRLSRFIKVRQPPSELAVTLPQKIVLLDGSLTSVTGKLVSCITARGGEIPVSMWSVPVTCDQRQSLYACIITDTAPVPEDLCLDRDGCLVIDDGSLLQNESSLTPCLCSISTGLMVVQSNGCVLSYDEWFFKLYLAHRDLERRHVSKLLSEIVKISSSAATTPASSLNSSSSRHSPAVCAQNSPSSKIHLLSGVGDISCLRKCAANEDESKGLLLPANCFVHTSPVELSQDEEVADRSSDESEEDDEEWSEELNKFLSNEAEAWKMMDFIKMPRQKLVQPTTSTPNKAGLDPSDKTAQPGKFDNVDDSVEMTNGIYSAKFLCDNGDFIDVTFKLGNVLRADGENLHCFWISVQDPEDSYSVEEELDNDDDDEIDGQDKSSDLKCNDKTDTKKSLREEKLEEEKQSRSGRRLSVERECEMRQKRLNQLKCDLGIDKKNPDVSLGHHILDQAGLNQSLNAAAGEDVLDLEQAIQGSFVDHYRILETLGQGSFGFVRRAFPMGRNINSVVVKFIKKSSMFEDSWHWHSPSEIGGGRKERPTVPLEVAILQALDHENIVTVLDVHQNDQFVQLVMEDFADLDLFDFIDQVEIDEALACHIFKQIVKAVDYLHSRSILHRDIKDENVIINSSFHCKLIDFGSASYFLQPGQLFYRFRGTMEYCSPEVHLGQGYKGPELDAWALGVTLFTVVYRENPYGAECVPHQMDANDLPFSVSDELISVLFGLLCCDPNKRFSVSKALASVWLRQDIDLCPYKWDEIFGTSNNVEY